MSVETLDEEEHMACDIEYEECIHRGKVFLKCLICKSLFAESEELIEHFTTSHLNENENSEICEETVNEEEHMACDIEYEECIQNGKIMLKCSICKSKFARSENLIEHFTTVHLNENIVLKCSICKSKFSNSEKLIGHIAWGEVPKN